MFSDTWLGHDNLPIVTCEAHSMQLPKSPARILVSCASSAVVKVTWHGEAAVPHFLLTDVTTPSSSQLPKRLLQMRCILMQLSTISPDIASILQVCKALSFAAGSLSFCCQVCITASRHTQTSNRTNRSWNNELFVKAKQVMAFICRIDSPVKLASLQELANARVASWQYLRQWALRFDLGSAVNLQQMKQVKVCCRHSLLSAPPCNVQL